jgi:hypothetical protein
MVFTGGMGGGVPEGAGSFAGGALGFSGSG